MYYTKRKLLSQNFLWNRELVKKLIRETSISSQDLVLEIGPGKGIITRELLNIAKNVHAIEKDKQLYDDLLLFLKIKSQRLTLTYNDILNIPLPTSPYKIFSNIPFSKTADIIRYLLESNSSLIDCYLIMQKEAAWKFLPSEVKNTLAATLYIPFWKMNIIHRFHRSDFHPQPNVDSVLLRIQPKPLPFSSEYKESYRDFVTYEFKYKKNAKYIPSSAWVPLFKNFLSNATKKQRQIQMGSFIRLRTEQEKLHKIYRTRNDNSWKKF